MQRGRLPRSYCCTPTTCPIKAGQLPVHTTLSTTGTGHSHGLLNLPKSLQGSWDMGAKITLFPRQRKTQREGRAQAPFLRRKRQGTRCSGQTSISGLRMNSSHSFNKNFLSNNYVQDSYVFSVRPFLLGEPAENAISSCSLQFYHFPDQNSVL